MTFRQNHVQTAAIRYLRLYPDVDAATSHIGGNSHAPGQTGLGNDGGLVAILSRIEDNMLESGFVEMLA